ncbi:MAG: hypothetical protein EOO10_03455 [Chitinophagaceae bacterium]|nr:MAG: hypothetical protein EOO10_03455 [Chitinophagaceae bacterium]
MSANDSKRLTKKGPEQPATLFSPATLSDANVILRNVIQNLSPEMKSEVVLRCDELVRVQGSAEDIETAFSQLLKLIVNEKPFDKKLFLHITCFHDKKGEIETIASGLQRYIIQFHTNVSLNAKWMQEAEGHINGIAALLLPFGGSFHVNQLKNSGCVFYISLPGK